MQLVLQLKLKVGCKYMTVPIKVIHIFGGMNMGGAENFIMNIYRNIDRSKIQFDFIVHTQNKCYFDDEIESLGGRIVARMPRFNGKNLFRYMKSWECFFQSNYKYRILHAHMRSTGPLFIPIAKKYGLKIISHSHGTSYGNDIVSKLKSIFFYPVRFQADYLFSCSNLSGIRNYGRKKVFTVINNCIITKLYEFNEDIRKRIRKELSLDDKFIVGHVGRFNIAKNHSFLIDIFHEIYKNNKDTVLLLVGGGELKSDIESKIVNLGLKDNVILLGVVANVPEILSAIDMLLFPSLYEGLPVTIIEAQAAGLRCIISDSITSEVILTPLVEVIALKQPAQYWAERLLAHVGGYAHPKTFEEIKKSGYDVEEVAKWLENFYLTIAD